MRLSLLSVKPLVLGIKELKSLVLSTHDIMTSYIQVSTFLSLQTHRTMTTDTHTDSGG